MAPECEHLDQIRDVTPDSQGCGECLAVGDAWIHLRMCLSCGHVACCDSSRNKHASKHFRASSHALVESAEPGEDWRWCYIDKVYI
ncbi:MAG TPA: UBP-type zinc finger domain-containing protein [Actinomycetota bacterium]|nr:UBP-type zinc finger domain-containing protein [Actinomycetota bacterium]